MEFTNDSGIIVKRLLPAIRCCKDNDNKVETFRSAGHILYDYFQEAERYYNHIEPVQARAYSFPECQHTALLNSHFVSDKIKKYIVNHVKYQLEYKCSILNRRITIRIDVFDEEELGYLDKYAKYSEFMFIFTYIFAKISNSMCSTTLSICLSPTPFKKNAPKHSPLFGVGNINSALTTRCAKQGDILIFRKEEWMKVFIHEAIHSFGLDIDDNISHIIHEELRLLFPIKSKFNISEAYTETWARIMNAAYSSYVSSKRNGEEKPDFITYLEFSLDVERLFSIEQSQKLLQTMKLVYANLYKNTKQDKLLRNKFYQEDDKTSAFAYYVLCGVFMNNYSEFMLWCNENNKGLLDFRNSNRSAKDFLSFIRNNYKIEPGLCMCRTNHSPSSTTRMSAIEISP